MQVENNTMETDQAKWRIMLVFGTLALGTRVELSDHRHA